MGPHRPRVRWNWGVPPRGKFRRAFRGRSSGEDGRGSPLGQGDWGSENAEMEAMGHHTLESRGVLSLDLNSPSLFPWAAVAGTSTSLLVSSQRACLMYTRA